jgi:tripartite-type tricarboxylate transporter receptor subunit TctC
MLCPYVHHSPAADQPLSARPLRIVTSGAGSAADIVARLIAGALPTNTGQSAVVENRSGSGVIAAQAVAKAPADGQTVLLYGGNIWLLPLLQDNVPYDPLRDFLPVTLAASSPNVLVIAPSLSARSVSELIAYARTRPGEVNYASGITASTPHLAAELFGYMAKIRIVRVTYKGTAPALTDLLGGRVQLMFPAAPAAMPHVRAGKLRALAVTSAEPTALAPGLPTLSASGLPGYESTLSLGVYAPAGVPAQTVDRLNRDVVAALGSSEVKEKLFNTGAEVIGSTPADLLARVKGDMTKWGRIIKETGMRAE